MKQLNLRLPDDLHARVKKAAEQDRRSINSTILVLIEQALAGRNRSISPPP